MPFQSARPLPAPGRERCLERLVDELGDSELGREFSLGRLSGLHDLRAQVPLHDAQAHAARVEPLLAAASGPSGPPVDAGAAERDEVIQVWRTWLAEHARSDTSEAPLRAGLLQARRGDPAVDAIAEDDLAALGAEVLRLHDLNDPARALERLEAFAPALLVSPSAAAFACLEEQVRGPLERRLPGLRLLLASFDVRLRLRARAELHSAGWIDPRAGRLGLPSPRPPARGFTLALASAIVELLPPEDERRGSREAAAVWPEHAIVGERYELVVSSGAGCLRLRTGEFVRVVGFDPPTALVPFPRPRVVRLPAPDPPVALAGLSLAGADLAASVRAAFRPEDPALVAATVGPDPQSVIDLAASPADSRPNHFADTELGSADVSGVRRLPRATGLHVQIELQGASRADFRARLARAIDEDLARRSPAYAHLRAARQLRPPRVELVPPGAFKEAWDQAARRLDHKVGAPVVRVRSG